MRSSSEESFEHIDPDFDNSYYPELRGVAVADYVPGPLEKDEVLIRKGKLAWAMLCPVPPPGVKDCCSQQTSQWFNEPWSDRQG